jgi:hypothetical protein
MGMECLIKKYYGRIKPRLKSASSHRYKEWIVVDADGIT